jgi:hypothetical protein
VCSTTSSVQQGACSLHFSNNGKISAVIFTRGKVHEYPGLKLRYNIPGQVSIDMIDYVKHMLEGFPKAQVERVQSRHGVIICSKWMKRALH